MRFYTEEQQQEEAAHLEIIWILDILGRNGIIVGTELYEKKYTNDVIIDILKGIAEENSINIP